MKRSNERTNATRFVAAAMANSVTCGILCLASFITLCPTAAGGEYYFVSQANNASDANDGTASNPLRTIYAALNFATPGDTIIVEAGDYRQDDAGWGPGVVPVLKSGTPNLPIRIFAAANAQAIVSKFFVQNVAHVRIQGFVVQGLDFAGESGWIDMPGIARNGICTVPLDFTDSWDKREAQIRDEFPVYFSLIDKLDYESGIDLENCTHVDVIHNRIEGYWAGIQCRGCSQLKINFNSIAYCVNGIYTWLPAPGLADSQIRSNAIRQCLDNGIDLRQGSRNIKVSQNGLSFNGISHISLMDGTRDILVEDNFCLFAGYYSETMEFPGSSAISVHSSGNGIRVRDNTISNQVDYTHIDGNGIAIDRMQPSASVLVQGNLAYRVMGDGVTLTESPNNIIQRNMFFECGFGATAYRRGAGVKFARESDIGNSISNNTFAFNRAAAILGEGTIASQALIDRNEYFLNDEPIMWDSYLTDEARYFRYLSIRLFTGWEANGMAYGPLAW